MFKLFMLALLPTFILCKDDYVIDLTEKDKVSFREELAKYDLALVEFFAPWCGHCKRLAPEYQEAAKILSKNDPYIPLVKVDCTSEQGGKELCSEYEVNGYPTLKIFRSGEISQDYDGPREKNGIVKYLKAQSGPASKEYKSFDELKKNLQKQNEAVVVGIFESEKDDSFKEFTKTASKLRESITFAHIFTKSASGSIKNLKDYVDVSTTGVVLVRSPNSKNKFENSYVVYDKTGSLEDFIKSNIHGLVGVRTHTNYEDFSTPVVIAYYAVDYEKNPKGTNYWRNRILKVAKDVKDKSVKFAISDLDEFKNELDGLDKFIKKDKPFVLARDKDNKKYILKEDFSVNTFKEYVDDFLAGKLEPFIKSELLPESNDGPVKVAVGKNFDELVLNNKKDVFIEFYAPWCGHCKKLAPVYDELGEKLKDEPNVDIVKIDATANDIAGSFEVRGFPTLYFLPSDTKQPKKYEGGREVKDFISFIAKHATYELEGYKRDGSAKAKEEL